VGADHWSLGRTRRHYHAVGVLPEPARRTNGYREYDLRDAVRLVRVRQLVELGFSLAEIADALRAGEGDDRELREVLADLEADLAHQEQVIRGRRRHLADLLARDSDLALSATVADVLREVAAAVPAATPAELARERELLEGRGQRRGRPVRRGRRAVPRRVDRLGRLAAMRALGLGSRRWGSRARRPRGRLAGQRAGGFSSEQFPELADDDESWQPAWTAFLATLPPAQRRCLELAWELRSRCAG
jgi:DNA-binding transcriptional MerR regulator